MMDHHFGFLGHNPDPRYHLARHHLETQDNFQVSMRRWMKVNISNSFKFFMINYKWRHDFV